MSTDAAFFCFASSIALHSECHVAGSHRRLCIAAGYRQYRPVSRLEARCGDASVLFWNSKKTVEQSHVEETRAASPPSILSRCDYQSRVVAWSSRFTLFPTASSAKQLKRIVVPACSRCLWRWFVHWFHPAMKRTGKHAPVEKIKQARAAIERASDAELRSAYWNSESLEEVIAIGSIAAARVLGQQMFDVQLRGAWALATGKIAEMQTGEGKTLAAVPAVLWYARSGRACM